MLRYKLRTLLIVLALGPPVLAGLWVSLLTIIRLLWPTTKPPIVVLIDGPGSSSIQERNPAWRLEMMGGGVRQAEAAPLNEP